MINLSNIRSFSHQDHLMSELTSLSAVELRRLIGRRALSPVELLNACIKQIEAVDGAVNALPSR
jgi:Asp-tRNA(Asn)/Glu-tRNA(Gln) amidotransferase A subunit family amidase